MKMYVMQIEMLPIRKLLLLINIELFIRNIHERIYCDRKIDRKNVNGKRVRSKNEKKIEQNLNGNVSISRAGECECVQRYFEY